MLWYVGFSGPYFARGDRHAYGGGFHRRFASFLHAIIINISSFSNFICFLLIIIDLFVIVYLWSKIFLMIRVFSGI